MPTFILASAAVALLGANLATVIAVIALLAWPQVARVARGEVLRLLPADYVAAARCLGLRDREILWGEIVPNTLGPVIALCTLTVANAMLTEAGLSFLGLSDAAIPSWGKMLQDGQQYLLQAPWMAFFPGLAIFATVLAFKLLGDALSSALRPRDVE
jgi:peptide/nickel transport system permease protein